MSNTFTVRHSYDEETVAFSLNGEYLGRLTYDEVGSAGMTAAGNLIDKIAEKLGATVEHEYGDDD